MMAMAMSSLSIPHGMFPEYPTEWLGVLNKGFDLRGYYVIGYLVHIPYHNAGWMAALFDLPHVLIDVKFYMTSFSTYELIISRLVSIGGLV
jgi:hypothetical protein